MNNNKEFECQQIEKMLEYQAVDKTYTELNEKVTKSEVAINYVKAQNERKRAVEEVVRINTLTEELYKNFDAILEQYNEVKNQIDEINACLEHDKEDIDGIDYYIKQLEKYDAKIEEIQNLIDQLVTELNHKRIEYKTEMDCANKAAALEKKYHGAFVSLRDENMQEAKEIQTKLKHLKEEIKDESLFNAYQEAKKRGIKRILVPYHSTPDLHVCGGCGVEVNVNVREKFEAGEVRVECPNCGRIIYNIDKE